MGKPLHSVATTRNRGVSKNSVEFDTVLDCCQDQHRRIVLAVLADQQRSLTMQDLTKVIFKHKYHISLPEASDEVGTKIQCLLHHVHLPKLSTVGLIEYDPEQQLVEPTKRFTQLQPTLSVIIDIDPDLTSPVQL